ncbi:MAG TPA: hypothetical protein VJZ75_08155 [Candidatus Bathyarchaeia archaeon]|nr:hypothetical protein [Candidatus Bathyarchaeia archaeon]
MALTQTDAKIIVSTLFSALIGVTVGNALNCIGNGCWTTDLRDILTACASIIVFLFTYYIVARHGNVTHDHVEEELTNVHTPELVKELLLRHQLRLFVR